MSTVLRSAAGLQAPPLPGSQTSVGDVPGAVPASDRNFRQFFLLLAQLALLIVLVEQFQLESEAFRRLVVLTVGGFAIHYFLPLRQRLGFFVLLSLAGIGLVLGPVEGAWLVGIGLGLIGIASLRLPLMAKAVLLGAIGLGLAVLRIGVGSVPWSSALWPILGSMFVFRLIIYLYDRAHETAPPRLSQTLGYFFLLPNVCFPLFPVVDFKKFCRNYYDAERHGIYQVGVEWIWRGLVQLILYRLIYYHLTLDSVAVDDLGDLAFYMLSTFMLYIRISGHFHLVIGMLHLFGFNLPETHHRYFLASSFTDFWRRINIYWKDFMVKVFYYPAFFRLRKLGDTQALVIATAYTFVVTWFLHLVQWFWIRGSLLIELNDVLFWTILGVLVLVNSLYESRRGRTRILKRARTLGESVSLVARTAATFCVICVLWSFWTAESVSDWLLMMKAAGTMPSWTAMQVVVGAAVAAAGTALIVYGVKRGWGAADTRPAMRIAPGTVLATTVVLCALTIPAVSQQTGQQEIVESLQSASLNRRDAEQFQRGYYENLLDVSRFNRELQQVYAAMPRDFVRSLSVAGLSRDTGDAREYELIPNRDGRFVGAMVHTNRWGMRDDDYSMSRPAGTYRIALLGPSTAMGSGVEARDSFEVMLENRLNGSAAQGTPRPFEILNFGVAGYSPLHQLYQLDRKVLQFEPNMAIFLGHVSDMESTSRQWARFVRRGILPQDPYHQDLVRRTGLTAHAGPTEARRRLKPYERELLAWVYRSFVASCKSRGITPVFVYMQIVTEPAEAWRAADRATVLEIARESGFTVLDTSGVYDGHPPSELWIAPNDGHPNALGSKLVADKLFALLQARREELAMPAIAPAQ